MSQEYIRVYKTLSAEKQNIDVPLADGFEDTLVKWKVTASASDGTATRDTTYAYRGGACLKLDTGATTPTAGDHEDIERYCGMIKDNIISCSLRFLLSSVLGSTTLGSTYTLINRETGKKYVLGIRYRQGATDDYFEYQTAIGTWTVFATVPYGISGGLWYNMEIVMDLNTGKYLYAIAGGKKYSLAGISPDVSDAAAGEPNKAFVTLLADAASQRIAYIDDVIIDKVV